MENLLISQKIRIDKYGQLLDNLERNYTIYFNSLNFNLYPISNYILNIDNYLDGIKYNGLVLSGGGDINPDFIVADNKKQYQYYYQREKIENKLIRRMIDEGLPILGICRGMQKLNAYFGGKITGDIFNDINDRTPGKEHFVEFKKKIFDLKGKYKVNNYHNHGIKSKQVADDFDIFTIDNKYDVIERIIHKNLPIIGIHCHKKKKKINLELNKILITKFFKN